MLGGALDPAGGYMNTRAWRAAEFPCCNMFADARSLARMYAATVSEVDSVRLLDPAPSVAVNRRVRDRKPADEMVVIVEDVIKLLDSVSESLRRGHYPDKQHGNQVAAVLKAVAADLEL